MKKFIGYYIIGAANAEDAKLEKGLLLWSQKRPGAMVRFFNRLLLGIFWVDKERTLERKQDAKFLNYGQDTQMERYKPAKRKANDNNQKRRGTTSVSGIPSTV